MENIDLGPNPPALAATGRRLLRGSKSLCVVHAVAALIAPFIIWYATESIIGVGPVLAVLGLILARVAFLVDSWRILLLALWHPLLTGVFALLIAVYHMGPGDVRPFAAPLFGLSAGIISLGTIAAMVELSRTAAITREPRQKAGLGFSLRTVLILMTAFCVVLAVLSNIAWKREWPFFAVYAAAMFVIALTLAGLFVAGKWRRFRTIAMTVAAEARPSSDSPFG
jgi:hypothetical protein